MKVTLTQSPEGSPNSCFGLYDEAGECITFVQSDWDYAGLASQLGWTPADVKADVRTWNFERFPITLTAEQIADCSHVGDCSADIEYHAPEINRPAEATPAAVAKELREYGAWDDQELSDHAANWKRIIWIAACDLKEEKCKHEATDGTVDCKECGCKTSAFLASAFDFLADHDGKTFEIDE